MTLTVLIVDDEPIARRRLGRLLRAIPHVQVLGEAGDVASAVAETRRLAPDLLLLDIRIPGGDGFDVIDRLGRDVPRVVFVTAFNHHAIRAFDLEAVDYVTKPVEAPRLARAIERARAATAASGQTERIPAATDVATSSGAWSAASGTGGSPQPDTTISQATTLPR
ncbi:LytR/AlgR family response regulator transcription factor [Amaricoccus sp.]|uniref:LytR/AlgR family response regulator transcription factor n=1 Tax=Amaricoccus sp. TaxID=1872485 RepID=UPI0039E36F4C